MLRLNWVKAFEDAVQSKNFRSLQPVRLENEQFLTQHMNVIRRLYAEGDGRALLSAVNNYMRIEQQFVRDVMTPTENFTANSQADIDKTYRKIEDFGEKEKAFLIDINNALRTEGLEAGSQAATDTNLQQEEEDVFEEPQGSIIEGRPKRKKGKLPHEQDSDEDQGKKKKRKKAAITNDEE